MREFPLRRAWWAAAFIAPLSPRRPVARIGEGMLEVRMGLVGGARIPLRNVERVGRMEWPWWGGVGARIGRGLVAFVAAPGPAAVVELSEPAAVRAPLPWRTRRVLVGAEDVDAFSAALREERDRSG